jgi:predicted transcriptional regulator
MTLTIELPDEAVETVRAAAARRGQEMRHFIVDAAIETSFAFSDEGESEYDEETSAEIVAAAREAYEDEKAGRLLTLEEASAQTMAALDAWEAARRPQPEAAAPA